MRSKNFTLWLPVFSMMLVSLISYIDRNILALLSPTILKEIHLSNQQYGFIITAFSIAYMIGNPIWGYTLDRIGVRRGMIIAVTVWSIASVSHVAASGLLGFIIARILLGLGEAATFPGCLRTVVQTLPTQLRSRGVAFAYSGGAIGALITPVIITPIAMLWGWRSAFWFTGLVGVAWLLFWVITNKKVINSKETAAIIHVKPNFRNKYLWAFMFIDAFGSFPFALINYFAPNYLHQAFHIEQLEMGKVLWIPPLGWEIGYFFWAWIADRLITGVISFKIINKYFFLLTILSVPFMLVPFISIFPLFLVMIFYVSFITSGFIILATAYAINNIPSQNSGLIGGLGAGSSAAVVAIMMPLIGKLFDLQKYDAAFLMVTIFPICGYIIWLILNRNFFAKNVKTY